MNLLLRESKFGFTKFSDKCPCTGGGGGGARICTTPFTQTKWTPNSTSLPKPNKPAPVVDGAGHRKIYGTPFGEKWEGEGPKEIFGNTEFGEEKCKPEEDLPPCECGDEASTYENRRIPEPPVWDSGTDESRNFVMTFSCDHNTVTNDGLGSNIGGGSYGIDHDLKENVTVPGKKFTKKWDFEVTEFRDCI